MLKEFSGRQTMPLFLYQPSLNRILMDRPSVSVFCMCVLQQSVVYILTVCLSAVLANKHVHI